jgi:hypothetical protein
MKEFENYFNENEILRQLCKIRVKVAKNRNKRHLLHLLTSDDDYNYHIDSKTGKLNEFEVYQNQIQITLREILPPRRQWVKIGSNSRIKNRSTNEKLTSNDKNFYSLLKTIKKHKAAKSKEVWFLNLQKYVAKIQANALSQDYNTKKPIIFPKLKKPLKKFFQDKDVGNKCRPLSLFSLEDRITLSLTNKFLTNLLDNQFEDSSYAFRSRKVNNKTVSHHNCIKDILEFKKKRNGKPLFVVECDMRSFYDTVNHKIVMTEFNELIKEAKIKNPTLNFEQPIHIFKSFLESYSFNKSVKKIDEPSYWSSYSILRGSFPWVDDELTKHYPKVNNDKIGIPQGGALSGLIANIYLNKVDAKLKKLDVLYIRFCDDMIVIDENYKNCKEAKKLYVDSLNNLKLFPHPFKKTNQLFKKQNNKINYKSFWDGKSKGPYRWSKSFKEYHFPWITFVGYEINFSNEIRVRKKSFLKEQTKQNKIVNEITNAIETEQRCEKRRAIESAINRLIGMSVGRIGLDNFSEVSTDMCWKNGFQELELNIHSKKQIKQLDRNRSALYYDLFKKVKELERDENENLEVENQKRQFTNYDKPFSYYYQILERTKNGNS